MITEIGALVGILKALLEAAKSGRELFGAASKKSTAEAIKKTQDRLAGIADQLFQSVALSKMLPIWLNEHATVDLYTDALTDDEVKLLDLRLRQLISDNAATRFLEGAAETLAARMSPELGRVLQDGGAPILGIGPELEGDKWTDLARKFFLT